MKLIIQIPCFNEAEVLPATIAALPREVPGFDSVEWLVIDDGSSDGTAEVALAHGVDHVVRLQVNRGLAAAFETGVDAALKLGADVIVNTDADNQYRADDIPKLVGPILSGQAEMVVGDRDVRNHEEFSGTKKVLQVWGSWVVRHASKTEIRDATSGFRAYTRDAALRLNVVSTFSYTLETLIQAGNSGLAVTQVPVRTNPKTRESRLYRSIAEYLKRSVGTIVRIYLTYEPLPIFLWPAAVLGLVGTALLARFGWFYITESGPTGHVQSLIVGASLIIFALQLVLLGVISELLRMSRLISERTLYRVRAIELALDIDPGAKRPSDSVEPEAVEAPSVPSMAQRPRRMPQPTPDVDDAPRFRSGIPSDS
jgi:glycosyltransferase involved in cell wall biosynthesis